MRVWLLVIIVFAWGSGASVVHEVRLQDRSSCMRTAARVKEMNSNLVSTTCTEVVVPRG